MDEPNAILKELTERTKGVLGELHDRFKGIKPLGAKEYTTEEKIWSIQNLKLQDIEALTQELGYDPTPTLQLRLLELAGRFKRNA